MNIKRKENQEPSLVTLVLIGQEKEEEFSKETVEEQIPECAARMQVWKVKCSP